ncbi:MAG: DNA gyrase subunit A [Actinomycetaceae bacterium]|nr:DNA gyrase subunit A [Actinomycetaceae bacterium]
MRSGSAKGAVDQVNLESEMQRSYLDYAMSVIVGRALPDVRDGLKPVHRRILYTMYDGGYRPNGGFHKSMHVVGDVLGNYHPHGDLAVYDALARMVQDWSLRYPMVSGQGNFGSPGNLGPAAPRYTECKMAPLSMEMVRDIDEDTVDFVDNYDGRSQEPVVLPARIPQLLLNGSEGIAVGMATRIPPHNLREVARGIQWYLEDPDRPREETLEGLIERIPGPDFPTGATILGRQGIEEAYRTGRGSIVQRAVVNIEELNGRTCLVITELPYQVNPDNLFAKIAQLVKDGQVQGIADMRDETSSRSGQRMVIVLKRDAVPKVVLNNLYKRTQLQDSFPANMLALVDGVPRTLSLDGFVRHWVNHQLDVIRRRTQFRLNKARERMHILAGYLKALDALDEVIALIRRSPTVEEARAGLIDLLGVDEVQADAILALQLRRLAALERQKIMDEHRELAVKIADFEDILASPQRQRAIISGDLAEIAEKYGDERRTTIVPFSGEMSMEDFIPREDVVVTITRSGYVKRTKVDLYRSQKRGGKGIRGAQLREDDVVEHFFTTTTHDWLAFFTNKGRVYRAKAYEVPEGGRDSKGQHVANLLAFQPDEHIAQVMTLSDYAQSEYLVLATRRGLIKKTRLSEYDSNRSGGIIAINLREDEDGQLDELVSAVLVNENDHLMLVSRKGQSLHCSASSDTIRATGRATSGVTGMRFRDDDELLTMVVARPGTDLLVVTEGGYAKRTPVADYRLQGRGGLGIKVANLVEARGDLVGALIVSDDSEVLTIMKSGKVQRCQASEVSVTGRTTQGVIFTRPDAGDAVISLALNQEHAVVEAEDADSEGAEPVASKENAGSESEGDRE